jgi:hypothetical protein
MKPFTVALALETGRSRPTRRSTPRRQHHHQRLAISDAHPHGA